MSCARVCPVEVLCVGSCVYNEMHIRPIQIGQLQRYATDRAYERGERFFKAGEESGRQVAIVGGGPGALAAAHELRRLGHGVTIFEREAYLGGLNTDGVAPYKMKAERSLEEVDWVLGIGGVELKLGVEVGAQIGFEQLERRFDAVILAAGLGPDRYMSELAGAEAQGVYGAVEFIARMKLGRAPLNGARRALVIGGGNTALDAARELRGLGVEQVGLVYRGDERRMSGYDHEWSEAKREGVGAIWRAQPEAFLTDEQGQLRAVRCHRLDEAREPIKGSSFEIEAQLVLFAIGQSKWSEALAGLQGVELDRGRVKVDERGATGRAGYFAVGDCANGGKEVVHAAAEGKRAARAIDEQLAALPASR